MAELLLMAYCLWVKCVSPCVIIEYWHVPPSLNLCDQQQNQMTINICFKIQRAMSIIKLYSSCVGNTKT